MSSSTARELYALAPAYGKPDRYWNAARAEYTRRVDDATTFNTRGDLDRFLKTHSHLRAATKPVKIPAAGGDPSQARAARAGGTKGGSNVVR